MDYESKTINNLVKWNVKLGETDSFLFKLINLQRKAHDNNLDAILRARRDIDKLNQQVAELRKELADLKKTENE